MPHASGGLSDIRTRTLRSPYPVGRALHDVWEEVLRTAEDRRTAEALGLRLSLQTYVVGPVQPGQIPLPSLPPPLPPPLSPAAVGVVSAGSPAGRDGSLDSPEDAGTIVARAQAAHDETTLQVVWWVKVLRDDPLRVLRALRFAAKLGFRLHDTFWLAVPFSLSSLQGKVTLM